MNKHSGQYSLEVLEDLLFRIGITCGVASIVALLVGGGLYALISGFIDIQFRREFPELIAGGLAFLCASLLSASGILGVYGAFKKACNAKGNMRREAVSEVLADVAWIVVGATSAIGMAVYMYQGPVFRLWG